MGASICPSHPQQELPSPKAPDDRRKTGEYDNDPDYAKMFNKN